MNFTGARRASARLEPTQGIFLHHVAGALLLAMPVRSNLQHLIPADRVRVAAPASWPAPLQLLADTLEYLLIDSSVAADKGAMPRELIWYLEDKHRSPLGTRNLSGFAIPDVLIEEGIIRREGKSQATRYRLLDLAAARVLLNRINSYDYTAAPLRATSLREQLAEIAGEWAPTLRLDNAPRVQSRADLGKYRILPDPDLAGMTTATTPDVIFNYPLLMGYVLEYLLAVGERRPTRKEIQNYLETVCHPVKLDRACGNAVKYLIEAGAIRVIDSRYSLVNSEKQVVKLLRGRRYLAHAGITRPLKYVRTVPTGTIADLEKKAPGFAQAGVYGHPRPQGLCPAAIELAIALNRRGHFPGRT